MHTLEFPSKTPEQSTLQAPSGKSLIDAFHPNQKEKIETFESQYWSTLNNLAQCLQLNPNELRSLISHESKFDPGAKNKHWSGWLMQLTKSPIKDLAARPERYSPFYKAIGAVDFSWLEVSGELTALMREMQEAKPNKGNIESLINPLSKKRTDPLINMVICSVYLAGLKNEHTNKESSLQESKKNISILLNSPEDLIKVIHKVQASVPSIQSSEAKKILMEALNNPKDLATFASLKRYNGNPSKEWNHGLIHSDIYAALLLVTSKLAGDKQTIHTQQKMADARIAATNERLPVEPVAALPDWLFA